jgi:hypothetical protein
MEQRFAVWLLMITDRLDGAAVGTTQERIAQHLGVRRAGITVVARELQFIGAISYTRGHLRVVNRKLLEQVACECYGTLGLTLSKPATGAQAERPVYASANPATRVEAAASFWNSHPHRAPAR